MSVPELGLEGGLGLGEVRGGQKNSIIYIYSIIYIFFFWSLREDHKNIKHVLFIFCWILPGTPYIYMYIYIYVDIYIYIYIVFEPP